MFLYALYGSKNLSLKNLHYQIFYPDSMWFNFKNFFQLKKNQKIDSAKK